MVYSVRALKVGYGRTQVLRGLDWELEEGKSFAIVGPSGEGKTLLLKTLSGLVPSYKGRVQFQGQEISKMSARQLAEFRLGIGMTFQKDGLFDSLTCADNLRFPLNERLKLTRQETQKRIDAGLESVGLAGQGKLFVHEMSGGMQKRLGIARALLFSPKVILYDEPSAGLDPITARSINELIISMRERAKMTVVVVTSDLEQAHQLTDRAGLLWQGRFEEEGSWTDLKRSSHPAVRQFLEGSAKGPLTEALE